MFYFTAGGWMMWNWLVSALASEATLVLYDGSPFHPGNGVLFAYLDDAGVDVFGVSAKYIDALAKDGFPPAATHDLGSLRTILSNGSQLLPETFDSVPEQNRKSCGEDQVVEVRV